MKSAIDLWNALRDIPRNQNRKAIQIIEADRDEIRKECGDRAISYFENNVIRSKYMKAITEVNVCPGCGTWWDATKNINEVCHYCGFDLNILHNPIEHIERCEEHPKYEGVGVPKSDCLTCWKMHKEYTHNKVKKLQEEVNP